MASWWSSKGDYSEPPAWAGWQHYRLWKKSVLRRDKNTDGLKLHEKLSSDKITASANIMTFEEDLRKTTEKIGLLEKKKAILEKSRAKLETLESGLEESEKKISSDIGVCKREIMLSMRRWKPVSSLSKSWQKRA